MDATKQIIATDNDNHNDTPLPLQQLRKRLSSTDYAWIHEGDEKQKELQKAIMEEKSIYNVSNLFGNDDSDDEDEETDDVNTAAGNDGKKKKSRVQHWCSSSKCLDGIGGFQPSFRTHRKDNDKDNDLHHVQLVYILSDSYKGFGDTLWSSARYLANVISNPRQCQEMISPFLLRRGLQETYGVHVDNDHTSLSPLLGVSFLELGAGAGLPSWAAMHLGARVVCTDISDTNRIRSMGECAERNYQLMLKQEKDANHSLLLKFAEQAKVCPHDWGAPIDNVKFSLNKSGKKKFDVIAAADCCYMPWLHDDLLSSIYNLLSDIGVAIISFALHGNTDDDDVWKIVDRAKERGFSQVEVLKSEQLSPPNAAMDSKQGLVHTVRLSK